MKILFVPFWCILLATSIPVSAAVTVNSSTADWTAITYLNPNQADEPRDEQANSVEGDIVGNSSHGPFYTNFSDTPGSGEIGFRTRLAGDKSNDGVFGGHLWIGIDANLDGNLDVFLGATQETKIGIYPGGDDVNTSPSTSSIDSSSPYFETAVTALNFNFSPVNITIDPTATNFNLDGRLGGSDNHTDHFVSFVLPFAALQSAINGLGLPGVGNTFNKDTPVRYVVATSTQSNTLNQDINGISGGIGSRSTWTELATFSNPFTPAGAAVPEPSTLGFALAGFFLLFMRNRRSRS